MKLYDIAGLDVECGLKNVNNQQDIYDMVLETYCQEAEEKMARYAHADRAFLQDNLQNTIIDMHGIKGASNGIGALELGEKFRKMEFAGKDGNIDYLFENMESCMEEYRALTEQIAAACGQPEESTTSGQLPAEVIDGLIRELEALDFDSFEDTMEDLLKQDFGGHTNHILKEVWEDYDNFDYEEAADLLGQLKG